MGGWELARLSIQRFTTGGSRQTGKPYRERLKTALGTLGFTRKRSPLAVLKRTHWTIPVSRDLTVGGMPFDAA